LTETNFRRDNHYVSCGYLKRWTSSTGRLWAYRILVSHENVPLWKESSIRGIAYHSHLYTRIAAGLESDEIEQWFEHEYETPAEEALQKATSNGRLTPSDWRVLSRFLAAQDVRTPARLVENLQRWYKTLPDLLQNTLQESVQKLELMKSRGENIPPAESSLARYFPLRIKTETKPNQEFGTLKAETIVGRGLWLFAIKHLLTKTADVLHKHRWTILSPPKGMKWFTSDDPVVRLNYHGPKKYDFGGGWGSEGTEIFMPLSPNHLLYTQIGKRPPLRGTQLSLAKAEMIRRFIAEHAHRIIFAAESDTDVPKLRPRLVSADLFRDEKMQWSKWHEDQTTAERDLMGWTRDIQEE
jgi:hypothetical protein